MSLAYKAEQTSVSSGRNPEGIQWVATFCLPYAGSVRPRAGGADEKAGYLKEEQPNTGWLAQSGLLKAGVVTHEPVKALLLNAVPHAFLQEHEQLLCGCPVTVSKLTQLLSQRLSDEAGVRVFISTPGAQNYVCHFQVNSELEAAEAKQF